MGGFFVYHCTAELKQDIPGLLRNLGIDVVVGPLKSSASDECFKMVCSRGRRRIEISGTQPEPYAGTGPEVFLHISYLWMDGELFEDINRTLLACGATYLPDDEDDLPGGS